MTLTSRVVLMCLSTSMCSQRHGYVYVFVGMTPVRSSSLWCDRYSGRSPVQNQKSMVRGDFPLSRETSLLIKVYTISFSSTTRILKTTVSLFHEFLTTLIPFSCLFGQDLPVKHVLFMVV